MIFWKYNKVEVLTMFVIKKNFGFCLSIPSCFFEKRIIETDSPLYEMIYNKESLIYFKKFRLITNLNQYYSYPELVMRGFLIREEILMGCSEWHYIDALNMISNTLCTKLINLNPGLPNFKELLFGKKDHFLHNVPVECLAQFYPHLTAEKLIVELSPNCSLIPAENFLKKSNTLVSNIYSPNIAKKLLKENCFYLEDIYHHNHLFKSLVPQLKKKELTTTLKHFSEYYLSTSKISN